MNEQTAAHAHRSYEQKNRNNSKTNLHVTVT